MNDKELEKIILDKIGSYNKVCDNLLLDIKIIFEIKNKNTIK